MIDKLTGTLQFNQDALRLRDQRQQVLANNIANADTPNFKARDFDFASELRKASAQNSPGATTLARTSAAHIGGSGMNAGGVDNLQYRIPAQSRLDGNTVDMDAERSKFLDNSVRYQADLTFMNSRIKSLRSAMQPE